ncbi:uncharacterized protein METZ01_LOCUS372482 [marine metagenome]|uniref:Uncharacterized protein n=1 Tax=marine metagenome TaxID=408172 RepID=A0A382TE49_9ZZZZ
MRLAVQSNRLLYYAVISLLWLTTNVRGGEIDFSIHVSEYAASEGRYIYITTNPTNAEETWYIAAECAGKPDLSVYIAHMPVAMEQYIFISSTESDADKNICITNKDDLDEKTLRLLKLTK